MSLLVATSAQAFAQTTPSTFPDDAAALAPAALQDALAGKVYAVKMATGPDWRWEFNANGYFYFNAGSFSDRGKWSVKDSTLCSEGKQIKASCNEVRQRGTALYLKRDNGDVVMMTPQ